MRKVINEVAFVAFIAAGMIGAVAAFALLAHFVHGPLADVIVDRLVGITAACVVIALAAYTVGFFTAPDPNEVDR